MSITFIQSNQKPPNAAKIRVTVQKMLDENTQLLQIITECQLRGKMNDCIEYQKVLHRNLVYLAKLADASADVNASLSTLGNQMESGILDNVIQSHSSGQGQMGNQRYFQQQGSFSQQEQSIMGQESEMFQNTTMSLMSQSGLGQMSQSSMGQNTIQAVSNQHSLIPLNQSTMSLHPSDMTQNSTSSCVIMPGSQGYVQQFHEQHHPVQSQYSQSSPAYGPQQVSYMPNQQNQVTSQVYSSSFIQQHSQM